MSSTTPIASKRIVSALGRALRSSRSHAAAASLRSRALATGAEPRQRLLVGADRAVARR